MTDETELRTASDRFLSRLDRLGVLEDEKRLLTPGSPRMVALAAEIAVVAREVLAVADTQLELASTAATQPMLRPIEAIPPREAHDVLTDGREAERRLTAAGPNTAEEALARADIERLRNEYRRAFELRARATD